MNGLVPCGDKYTFPNGTAVSFNLCGNRNDYLFWDDVHPTQKVHRMLTLSLWSGNKKQIDPVTVKHLAGR